MTSESSASLSPHRSSLRVHFLGSGDAFGSGGRLQTCILLASDAGRVLLDCGATSLVALKRAGVDPGDIDAVLLTHLHGDHFGGLPFLMLDAQFSRRERPLLVAGPPGVEARVRAAQEVLFPGSAATARRFELRFLELQPETSVAIGVARVTAYPVDHASGAPAYALRVECADRSVAYTGDTAWTDALTRAADGVDLLIAEAYFFEKQVRYHLDYRTLSAHRHELRCRRLILTHMSAEMLARRDEIDVECADDGLNIDL